MKSSTETRVLPGDAIEVDEGNYKAGNGVYIRKGKYFALLSGIVDISNSTISVKSSRDDQISTVENVPKVGQIYYAIVDKLSPRICQVLVVDPKTGQRGFHGIIRKENVRQSEVDKVEMVDCFRPGDLIKAKLVALGSSK